MLRLTCPRCGLSYAAATLPHFLAASAGASCPHCGTPMAKSPEDAGPVSAAGRGGDARHGLRVPRARRRAVLVGEALQRVSPGSGAQRE